MVTAASIILTNILSRSQKSRSEKTLKDLLHYAADIGAQGHCPRYLNGSFASGLLQVGPALLHTMLIKNYRIKVFSVCLVKSRSIPREILAQIVLLGSTAEWNENKRALSVVIAK